MAEPVEIKISLAGQVSAALATLGLGAGKSRSIWFLEDVTPGLPDRLPLLAAGIILRLRTGEDGSDSTVKLRPLRRSALTSKWVSKHEDVGFEYRIEFDWTGRRQVLAASATQDVLSLQGAVNSDQLTALFSPSQVEFLADCADIRVNIPGLIALGPIKAMKWEDVIIGDFKVNAERWTVGDLDFLELSIKVKDFRKAAEQQPLLHKAVNDTGLELDVAQEPKTRTVLEFLAGG